MFLFEKIAYDPQTAKDDEDLRVSSWISKPIKIMASYNTTTRMRKILNVDVPSCEQRRVGLPERGSSDRRSLCPELPPGVPLTTKQLGDHYVTLFKARRVIERGGI